MTKNRLIAIMGSIVVFILIFLGFFYNGDKNNIHAKVLSLQSEKSSTTTVSNIRVKILNGTHKNEIITVQNKINDNVKGENTSRENTVKPGNEVLINIDEDSSGKIKSAYISEMVKYKSQYLLIAMFSILVVVIGGSKGIKSIITLIITGFALLKILLPLILAGFDPIFCSVFICIGISILNLLIISGKNKKTLAAIIGTSSGVLISGIIALYYSNSLQLKGFNDDEIQMLIYVTNTSNFNYRGLLFAGILMGALGAVMDVSMSIASSMNEIYINKTLISFKELFKSGMNIGKDIMGSMANTLILAYAGGAIYTILLISSSHMPINQMLDQDVIASEVIKALSGSIGLIFSIPVTALAYSILTYRRME